MINKLFNTDESISAVIVRLTLGLVLLPHGMQKLFGLFGGHGFSATMDAMTGMGLPALLVFLIIMAESFGAVSLILGIGTRFSAISITIIMIGALLIHLPNGFFMNWYGAQAGEGFEYHILAIGLGISSLISGGGRFSLDRIISNFIKMSNKSDQKVIKQTL
jgi:putative oxidoreductase